MKESLGGTAMNPSLEESIIDLLKHHQIGICTVESCTGGLLAHTLTQVPGSSQVFWGAMITYDHSAKQQLGVQPETLLQYGSVSEATARELAEAGLQRMKTSLEQATHSALPSCKDLICISTTGIAGPTGGSVEKPVGLCFIGLARLGRPTQVLRVLADSRQSRTDLKQEFAPRALKILLQDLQNSSHGWGDSL